MLLNNEKVRQRPMFSFQHYSQQTLAMDFSAKVRQSVTVCRKCYNLWVKIDHININACYKNNESTASLLIALEESRL